MKLTQGDSVRIHMYMHELIVTVYKVINCHHRHLRFRNQAGGVSLCVPML